MKTKNCDLEDILDCIREKINIYCSCKEEDEEDEEDFDYSWKYTDEFPHEGAYLLLAHQLDDSRYTYSRGTFIDGNFFSVEKYNDFPIVPTQWCYFPQIEHLSNE